ncbi:MAG: hypothetical protein LBL59_07775 [Xanthomonadaceae bacterium]|jgi:hypothetical protein|nr:hypothetical protein [Xanthomonadaceae bacterium]
MTSIPAPAPRSVFITVMAWISLAIGIMGAVGGLMQVVMLLAFSPADMLQSLFDQFSLPLNLSPSLEWTLTHLELLNFLSTLLSAAFAWVSYGLLKRFEWGRLGFIVFLAMSVVLIFGSVEMFLQMLDWLAKLFNDLELAERERQIRNLLYAAAGVLAAMHGWIIYKLCTHPIRAEFEHDGHRRH